MVILPLSVAPFSAARNTVNLARCWKRNGGGGVHCRLYFIALFRHQFPKSLLVSFQRSPRSTPQPLNLSNSIHRVFMACSCKGRLHAAGQCCVSKWHSATHCFQLGSDSSVGKVTGYRMVNRGSNSYAAFQQKNRAG